MWWGRLIALTAKSDALVARTNYLTEAHCDKHTDGGGFVSYEVVCFYQLFPFPADEVSPEDMTAYGDCFCWSTAHGETRTVSELNSQGWRILDKEPACPACVMLLLGRNPETGKEVPTVEQLNAHFYGENPKPKKTTTKKTAKKTSKKKPTTKKATKPKRENGQTRPLSNPLETSQQITPLAQTLSSAITAALAELPEPSDDFDDNVKLFGEYYQRVCGFEDAVDSPLNILSLTKVQLAHAKGTILNALYHESTDKRPKGKDRVKGHLLKRGEYGAFHNKYVPEKERTTRRWKRIADRYTLDELNKKGLGLTLCDEILRKQRGGPKLTTDDPQAPTVDDVRKKLKGIASRIRGLEKTLKLATSHDPTQADNLTDTLKADLQAIYAAATHFADLADDLESNPNKCDGQAPKTS